MVSQTSNGHTTLVSGNNVSTLAVRAGFGAMNCQATTNDERSTKLEHSTTPCLVANVCYGLPFFQDNALGGLCKTHNYYD
jgi:hypothetical protein